MSGHAKLVLVGLLLGICSSLICYDSSTPFPRNTAECLSGMRKLAIKVIASRAREVVVKVTPSYWLIFCCFDQLVRETSLDEKALND
ncbi:hypothetical protein KIN20_036008 [Parelaphostrongylus tenuis]|uniref:Secreted protein n=1 Tax=Parelaphostrongylus tenuis TaxID=148309 RepID=A0AAD5RCR3_PARTN|nr:hypothetical protein KIN20_036008 [Parelaphostrongylus tenuis]